ncbi:MAG: M20 peptidase aminoacylase family protein [Bacillales bacterium]|nr:M20 peptidase aminoacylase family protein [Bacillales bacterium]
MKKELEPLKPVIRQLFDYFHHHPEKSWHEYGTTRFIAEQMQTFGYKPKTFTDCTGVVAEFGQGKNGLCVGVRSDMDALWQEKDGIWQANHSCGHDAHMAIVLGVMLLFKKINYRPPGKLMFLFQPAEEKGTGALKMIDKGVIDRLNYLYGVHLRPIQELRFGQASPSINHGASASLQGEIHGEDAHAARPQLGQNAIEVGAALVNALNQIHFDPRIPYSVKLTSFHAGGDAANLIPGKASFRMDIRAQTNETMKQLLERISKIFQSLEIQFGAKIHAKIESDVKAAAIHPEAERIMAKAIIQTLGKEGLVPSVLTTGGEDFHYYTFHKPDLKATMLGLGCDLRPGLHHPNMTFQTDAIFTGIEILANAVIRTFAQAEKGEEK